jgi:hypothetical protein
MSSLTSTVPAAVPSLFQSLSPDLAEKGENRAPKKSVPLTLVRSWASMALTIAVPAGVPSVRHSPVLTPSWAVKNTVPPASTKGPGDDSAVVLKVSSMSLTRNACVSALPPWAVTTETDVASTSMTATPTVHAFTKVRIAVFPPCPLWSIHATVRGMSQFTAVNGTLFFINNVDLTFTLWKSDGTAAGTVPVTGWGSFRPSDLTAAGGTLFFTMRDGRDEHQDECDNERVHALEETRIGVLSPMAGLVHRGDGESSLPTP